jgi:hypothetical protein
MVFDMSKFNFSITSGCPFMEFPASSCSVLNITIPSKNDTMLRANATVIHLGIMDTVNVGSNPTRRPTRAVEYNENSVATMTDVKISAACLLTSCRNTRVYKLTLP